MDYYLFLMLSSRNIGNNNMLQICRALEVEPFTLDETNLLKDFVEVCLKLSNCSSKFLKISQKLLEILNFFFNF